MALPMVLARAAVRGTAWTAKKGFRAAKWTVKAPFKAGTGALNTAWQAGAAWDLLNRMAGNVLPSFSHGCTVTVRGGPDADLRRVWYLCCAAAFGRMAKSPAIAGDKAMTGEWDVSGKACRIEVAYQANILATAVAEQSAPGGLIDSIDRAAGKLWTDATTWNTYVGIWNGIVGGGALPGLPARVPGAGALQPHVVPRHFIQVGPDQITVGARWPDFLMSAGQVHGTGPVLPSVEGNGRVSDPRYGGGKKAVKALPNVVNALSDLRARNPLREWPLAVGAGGHMGISFIPLRANDPYNRLSADSARGVLIVNLMSPTLPDDGRLITTGEKTHPGVQSPRPMVDGATRTSLLALVAQSLTSPCYLPEAPKPTAVPRYSRGLFVHAPGQDSQYGVEAPRVMAAAPQFDPAKTGWEDATIPSDKYPDGNTIPAASEDTRGS